jgi:hypothetical protein
MHAIDLLESRSAPAAGEQAGARRPVPRDRHDIITL